LLAVRRHNEAHGNPDAELFEIANVYQALPGEGLPNEPTRLALVSSRDYFGLKGVIEALVDRLNAGEDLVVRPADVSLFTPGRCAELLLGDSHLGYLGEINHVATADLELRELCTAAELEFGVLESRSELVASYRPLPPYPAVTRDLSLVISQQLAWSDLATVVTEVAGSTLEAIEYLDTFKGGTVPAGKQSLHFGLRFRHPERTLSGDEVERGVKAIIDACSTRLEATLRS